MGYRVAVVLIPGRYCTINSEVCRYPSVRIVFVPPHVAYFNWYEHYYCYCNHFYNVVSHYSDCDLCIVLYMSEVGSGNAGDTLSVNNG